MRCITVNQARLAWRRLGKQVAAYSRSVRIEGIGIGGKAREETLEIRSLNNARAVPARKGKAADPGFKPVSILRVE